PPPVSRDRASALFRDPGRAGRAPEVEADRRLRRRRRHRRRDQPGRGVRLVDGYPRPMTEQETRAVTELGSGAFELVATLPVGGTAITTNSLYGEVRVQPLLDGR